MLKSQLTRFGHRFDTNYLLPLPKVNVDHEALLGTHHNNKLKVRFRSSSKTNVTDNDEHSSSNWLGYVYTYFSQAQDDI